MNFIRYIRCAGSSVFIAERLQLIAHRRFEQFAQVLQAPPAGHERFGDFIRIGVPFTVLVMIVSVVMVPLVLPL